MSIAPRYRGETLRPNQNRAHPNGRSRAKSPNDGGLPQTGLADEARFIRAWLDNPLTTGAVSPSGRFLAAAMARHIDPAVDGLVVELGPGTGPVTQAMIRRGVPQERLVLVEFDAAFCKLLERRFPKATIIQGDAVRLRETLAGKIDAPIAAVVSSLPLLNMPDAQRLALLADAFALMPPDGRFVQFTYGLASPMPRKLKGGRPDLAFTSEVSAHVGLNLPPARVWIYRPGAEMNAKKRPGEAVILKLKQSADKMKLELLETRAKVGNEIRMRKDKMKSGLDKAATAEARVREARPKKVQDR
jgi:phosphatidylethanolamine/phosphatidyl-N-methylethanolamine N-methyltransferase